MEKIKEGLKIENLMTVPAYASLRGVSRQTVYNWVKDGQIKMVDFLGRSYIDKSTYKHA